MEVNATTNFDARKLGYDIRVQALNGLSKFANAVMVSSYPITPKKSGELRRKRRKESIRNGVSITWQSDHAAVQEAGRRRGARPFTRYTTPGTGKAFVAKGLKMAERGGVGRYFR